MMSTLVYMKLLEQSPDKYDRGMRLLTLGRINRIKQKIAASWVAPGHKVLEIGCGTGSLAALMVERGAHVLGIDIAGPMLEVARKAVPKAEFLHMTATEIDTLGTQRFDRIVATLSFSELSETELDYVLKASVERLAPGGKLVIADEMPSSCWWQRILACLVRWPLAALTFLLTQNTTHVLRHFEEHLNRAGYRVLHRERYLLGTLVLVIAEKT